MSVFVVRGTTKLLERAGGVDLIDERSTTTVLGDWYVTTWFWRTQVALFVHERTLLPGLLPMAPASTVVERFVLGLPEVFRDHALDPLLSLRRSPRCPTTAWRRPPVAACSVR